MYTHAGSTSTTHGFQTGNAPASNTIQKFSFDNGNIVNDVGDLPSTITYASGNED